MSNHTYIKYLTEQIVTYMNKTPKERQKRKQTKKNKLTYSNHWFGLIPFAFKTMFKNNH